MMKSSYIILAVVISALTFSQSAYANQENVSITIGDRDRAGVLLTEPATINTTWSNFLGQTNNSKQTAESISLMQERGCQKINPLEFINNPSAFFKQCQEPIKTPSTEPIEYLKVPKLDSGISVTVTKF
ncbi:MAG: hypothetical protein RMY64_26905 [Nostoc sp. DedQUE08]|uniref:hypothetical protein n=1 Tax=Nostoc sp. DedQUE08 TaxID=3075393 RepID=UPI002AD4BE7A|nr:hypothetical protein [Nostoc sp. DedQUE08]MDZ8069200.1 hypothetical protein [Nostoc sp. DedQUE08]